MVNSLLKNQYKKYWIEEPVEHHKNIIGEYHVSSIGCDNQHLSPDDHAGPCLRQTFYGYVAPMEFTNQTAGNFHIGTISHKEIQRIYKLNHDAVIDEYPLGLKIKIDDDLIKILGSIDITDETFDIKPLINLIDIIDFKTASDWTFPKDKDDKNPTNFNQVNIYGYILFAYKINRKYNKIRNLKLVYIAKHNLYTGEQSIQFDAGIALLKFTEFITRVKYLHSLLKEYYKIMEFYKTVSNLESRRKLICKETTKCLPKKEPNKWCKFCDYRQRCYADVIEEKDVPIITLKEVEDLYMRETGKSSIWRGNYTKGFDTFKYRFKVKD